MPVLRGCVAFSTVLCPSSFEEHPRPFGHLDLRGEERGAALAPGEVHQEQARERALRQRRVRVPLVPEHEGHHHLLAKCEMRGGRNFTKEDVSLEVCEASSQPQTSPNVSVSNRLR